MSMAKIAISIDQRLLQKIDRLVVNHMFKNRSQAISVALSKSIEKIEHSRLAQECRKLDPAFEKNMAEGLNEIIA